MWSAKTRLLSRSDCLSLLGLLRPHSSLFSCRRRRICLRLPLTNMLPPSVSGISIVNRDFCVERQKCPRRAISHICICLTLRFDGVRWSGDIEICTSSHQPSLSHFTPLHSCTQCPSYGWFSCSVPSRGFSSSRLHPCIPLPLVPVAAAASLARGPHDSDARKETGQTGEGRIDFRRADADPGRSWLLRERGREVGSDGSGAKTA